MQSIAAHPIPWIDDVAEFNYVATDFSAPISDRRRLRYPTMMADSCISPGDSINFTLRTILGYPIVIARVPKDCYVSLEN